MAARRDTAARRYAEAASEIAMRDGTVEVWRSELDMAGAVVEDPAVARILANPAVALESRDAMVDSAIGSIVSGPVLNLVKLMLRRGRIEQLPQVAAEFRRLDNARQGIVPATATSASPLSQDEVRALVARLEQMTGARIELDLQVDPSLLGGLMVRVGDGGTRSILRDAAELGRIGLTVSAISEFRDGQPGKNHLCARSRVHRRDRRHRCSDHRGRASCVLRLAPWRTTTATTSDLAAPVHSGPLQDRGGPADRSQAAVASFC